MKKYFQMLFLVFLYFGSVNVNAATLLEWVGGGPSGASLHTFAGGRVLFGNKFFFSPTTNFSDEWQFQLKSTDNPTPGFRATFTFNDPKNFENILVYVNGNLIGGGGLVNSVSSSLVAGINKIKVMGDTIAPFNNFDVRITPTPIPAAVWLFGSALIGIRGLASRRKRLHADALQA